MGWTSPTSLVGREAEVARLESVVGDLAAGRRSIVVIEGEAGIGKTHVLNAVLASPAAQACRVFTGRARELEQFRPFAAIAEALGCVRSTVDPRRAPIAALVAPDVSDPALRISDDAGLQFRIVDALVGLLEEETLSTPGILVVEDLQWSDPATVVTLDAIAHRLPFLPLMVVTTLRAVPRPSEVVALLDSLDRLGAERVALGPLDHAAAVSLVGSVLAAEVGPTLTDRIAAAGGNPMFLIELVSALADVGAIEPVDGRAEVTGVRLPASLREAVLARVGFLSDETLHALRLAAVLGTNFRPELLAAIAGHSAADLTRVLAPALRACVLEDRPDGLCFRHDLVQEAIYDDVPESLRSALHREVADRLARAGADAAVVAEHYWRSAAPEDETAVEWLERAAAKAALRSPAAAVDLLGRALALASPAFPRRTDLEVRRAACLLWTGNVADSAEVSRAVLAHDPGPEHHAQAACWLGLSLLALGQIVEAGDVFSKAALAPSLDEVDAARLLAYAAQARLLLGDLQGAADKAETARAAADAAGDAFASCLAIAALTYSTFCRGHFRDALELAEDGVRMADRSPGRAGHRFQMELFRANCLLDMDRIGDAMVAMERGLRLCTEQGTRWNLPIHHTGLAAARFITGDWDDALADCATASALAEETATRFGHAYTLSIQALIAVHRDELIRARALVATSEQEQRESGLQHRADWTTWSRALLLETEGRPADAYRKLQKTWDAVAALGFVSEAAVLGPDLVRLALLNDEGTAAEQTTRVLEDVAASEDVPWIVGAAMRCRGAVDDDADALLAAVDAYRSTTRPLDAAIARELAASALIKRGRTAEARALLPEALEYYAALKVPRGLRRVTAALRELGVRHGTRGTRRQRPKTGWDSLTDTERRVVALVAEGLSNPQVAGRLFISSRTVQTHLSHVFEKLGLSTRAALAAAAARRPTTGR